MKILNLYAGIGGNRKLWGNDHEVTAVELNPDIADVYKHFFPHDRVIIEDAHKYLLYALDLNYYDFIWASPPCPSHSRARTSLVNNGIIYPDMSLYQEIIVLQHFFKGTSWVVENVIPYYKPLIQPSFEIDRHLFWSNQFIMTSQFLRKGNVNRYTKEELAENYGYDLNIITSYKVDARQVLRNAVRPELGKYILDELTGNTL